MKDKEFTEKNGKREHPGDKNVPVPEEKPAGSHEDLIITPIPFRAGDEGKRKLIPSRPMRIVGIGMGLLCLVLCYMLWYFLTSRLVSVFVEPEPERTHITGILLAPHFGSSYLLRPGEYKIQAYKDGYDLLDESFQVSNETNQRFSFTMDKLPGRLSLVAYEQDNASRPVDGAIVSLDGTVIGETPLQDINVAAGVHRLQVAASRYKPFGRDVSIEGMGRAQHVVVPLLPDWGEVSVSSNPEGAHISVHGVSKGSTPSTFSLPSGRHEIILEAEGFNLYQTAVDISAGEAVVLPTAALEPADGKVTVYSKPAGAQVTVGRSYRGRTPVTISVAANTDHRVQVSQTGYEPAERTVRLAPRESADVTLTLTPRLGLLNISVEPADAEIFVDGHSRGMPPVTMKLVAVEHRISVVKEGYDAYEKVITPRPGFPQVLNVVLRKHTAPEGTETHNVKASNGYTLTRIEPGRFTMGSSRREQGRRSNETLREIVLSRPFYMGTREVTNREFRQYSSMHSAGAFKGQGLDGADQPVVRVSWEQAALFCNWLSAKDGLAAVYIRKEGTLVMREPVPAGYRLPTEAEWEYCARSGKHSPMKKYPWGSAFPPRRPEVNLADESARDILPGYITAYRDGYPVTSPVGSFAPNSLGLYDMGGNAAEWCHDFYSIYSVSPQKIYRDPFGPQKGEHHVMRGSSWKDAGISPARSAYRAYGNTPREDVGFRICRYVR